MSSEIAAVVYAIGILCLFALDHDRGSRASKALWIPVLWLLIGASRPVSYWLQMAPPTSETTYLEGSPLDRYIFLCLSAVGLIVLLTRGQSVGALLRTNRAILLFFIYCGASVLWSDYSEVALRRWIKALGDLVMVLIVLTGTDPAAAIKGLLSRAGFLLLPLSMLFAKYYGNLGREYRPGDFQGSWNTQIIGVTTDKNGLGMITLIFGLSAVWQLLGLRQLTDNTYRRKRLIAQAALLATALWIFWIANSMTALFCFLLGSGLLILTDLWALFRRPAILHTTVVALLCVSLFAVFIAPDLLAMVGRNPTLTGRTELWNRVLGMTGNPLLGTGFDSFWLGTRLEKMWSIYWWHPNEAHNGYLEVFLNLGWLGVVLFALVLLSGYRNIIAAIRRHAEASSLLLAYFIAALVYNLTESGIRELDPIWFVLLLAIIAVPVPQSPPLLDMDQVDELTASEAPIHDLTQVESR